MTRDSEEHKIAQIFEKHYGREDALEIEHCIKSIMLDEDEACQERLVNVLEKNDWSVQDARSFVDALLSK